MTEGAPAESAKKKREPVGRETGTEEVMSDQLAQKRATAIFALEEGMAGVGGGGLWDEAQPRRRLYSLASTAAVHTVLQARLEGS